MVAGDPQSIADKDRRKKQNVRSLEDDNWKWPDGIYVPSVLAGDHAIHSAKRSVVIQAP